MAGISTIRLVSKFRKMNFVLTNSRPKVPKDFQHRHWDGLLLVATHKGPCRCWSWNIRTSQGVGWNELKWTDEQNSSGSCDFRAVLWKKGTKTGATSLTDFGCLTIKPNKTNYCNYAIFLNHFERSCLNIFTAFGLSTTSPTLGFQSWNMGVPSSNLRITHWKLNRYNHGPMVGILTLKKSRVYCKEDNHLTIVVSWKIQKRVQSGNPGYLPKIQSCIKQQLFDQAAEKGITSAQRCCTTFCEAGKAPLSWQAWYACRAISVSPKSGCQNNESHG